MKLNVKLFKIILPLTLILLILNLANAITYLGNTTVDGSTRTAIIYDVTETSPYIIANTTTTFHYFILYQDGTSLENANVNLTLNSEIFNLAYSPSTQTYYTTLYFNSTEIGDYDFIVQASKTYNNIDDLEGTYYVRNFIKQCWSLWNNENLTERYDHKLAHLFAVPHNKSRATQRIPELFYPLEFIIDTTFAKANRYLSLPEQRAITSLDSGFHKQISTTKETCMALPKDEVYTLYLVEGENLKFLNKFHSKYTYETIKTNTFLMTGETDEVQHTDIYVSNYDTHPVMTVVTYILWSLAIIFMIVIPIYVGLTSGQPKVAVAIFGGLAIIIPAITILINMIIRWIFI